MEIKVNGRWITVNEPYLHVRDNRLYNTKTKEEEGVDGDIVEFKEKREDGRTWIVKGDVDGYTNGKEIRLKFHDDVYKEPKTKIVEHIYMITDVKGDPFYEA